MQTATCSRGWLVRVPGMFAARVLAVGLAVCFVVGVPGRSVAAERSNEVFVDFSFDQVDVATFVKLVGDLTGRRFVIGEDVKGKLTVVSPRVQREQVYPLFVKILESAGCSVARDGDVERIVKMLPRTSSMGEVIGPDGTLPADGIVTKIMRLEHVAAADMQKVLESKVMGGKSGGIDVLEETNHLIVTDTADTVRRIEQIVAEVDRPGLTHVTEVIPLQFASAADLAGQLNEAIAETATRGERLAQRLPQAAGTGTRASRSQAMVVASPHANSLIVIGAAAQISGIRELIQKMDIDTPMGRGRLNAIFLKYMKAVDAEKSINALLDKSVDSNDKTAKRRAIAISADSANNALLIDASPSEFDLVKKLIDQLDQAPQQVHITVVIAEISLTDALDFGVQMAALDMPSKVGDSVLQAGSTLKDGATSLMNTIQQGIMPGGLTVGLAYGTRIDDSGRVVTSYPGVINIDAVKKDSRLDIISETSLEAQNNREASVNIVNEIPILKSTIQGGSGSSRDVIQNIDRVSVGIKLKLTPHIIPGGEVQMELNPSIEAVIDAGSADTQFTPTIARREVNTTVTVPDGEMIVIAGLTRTDSKEVERRVPLLGSIPLIGRLFRHTSNATEKTNLLIFVTPRIVGDIATAREIKDDWRQRTGVDSDEKR